MADVPSFEFTLPLCLRSCQSYRTLLCCRFRSCGEGVWRGDPVRGLTPSSCLPPNYTIAAWCARLPNSERQGKHFMSKRQSSKRQCVTWAREAVTLAPGQLCLLDRASCHWAWAFVIAGVVCKARSGLRCSFCAVSWSPFGGASPLTPPLHMLMISHIK